MQFHKHAYHMSGRCICGCPVGLVVGLLLGLLGRPKVGLLVVRKLGSPVGLW
jgi:hypothetical protein